MEYIQQERQIYMMTAKLAQEVERYDDMITAMTSIIQIGLLPTKQEREVLDFAFKTSLATRYSSLNLLLGVEKNNETSTQKQEMAGNYRHKIATLEIMGICQNILSRLPYLIQRVENEDKIFYLRMRGDYNKVMAELIERGKQEQYVEQTEGSYKEALELCKTLRSRNANVVKHTDCLHAASGLAEFYSNYMQSQEKACEVAEASYIPAQQGVNTLQGEDRNVAENFLEQLKKIYDGCKK